MKKRSITKNPIIQYYDPPPGKPVKALEIEAVESNGTTIFGTNQLSAWAGHDKHLYGLPVRVIRESDFRKLLTLARRVRKVKVKS